jgi:superfamily II DNA or RNA helicase
MLIDPKQQLLHQAYRQLSDVQKSIVQIFALLGEPTNRERARLCWSEAMLSQGFSFLEGQSDGQLEGHQFSEVVRVLVSRGLLSQQRNQGPCCHALLQEIVLRDAVAMGTFEPMAQAIEQRLPIRTHYQSSTRDFRSPVEFMRSLRIAIYREDAEAIETLFSEILHVPWRADLNFYSVLRGILTNPFDADWMRSLSEAFREMGLSAILENAAERCVPANEAFELLGETYGQEEISLELCLLYAEQLWLRGCLEEAKTVLADVEDADDLGDFVPQYEGLKGAMAFLTGDTQGAIAHYRLGIQSVGHTSEAQAAWFEYPASLLFFFALLENGQLEDGQLSAYKEAENYTILIQQTPHHWLKSAMPLLQSVLQMQQDSLSLAVTQPFNSYRIDSLGLPALIEMYSLYWLGIDDVAGLSSQLAQLCQRALEAGYGWIALETAELLVSFQPESVYVEMVEALREQTDSLPLIDVIEKKDAWERSLNALVSLSPKAAPIAKRPSTFRIAWRLRFHGVSHWSLTPLEQKIGAKGGWTKGKPIALKRLYTSHERPDYATEQDLQIFTTLDLAYENSSYYYRTSQPVYFFTPSALLALAGHPLVFWEESPTVRVEVVAGEPELLVKRLEGDGTAFQGNRLSIELSPPIKNAELLAFKETPTRLKVISVTADHRRIAEVLGSNNRLEVPAAAEERVLEAIASVANLVTVQSDIGGGVEAEEVPSNATPHIHLLPAGDGLKVSVLAHPFPQGGSYYPPGQGGKTVIAEVEGKRLKTQRNLTAERENAQAIIAACPIFEQYDLEDSEWENGEWLIDEPSDCLDLLLQLQELGEAVTIEWPEGEKFKVSRQLGMSDFRFDIRQQQDWFAASGEVQISENHVMDLRQLMALLEGNPGQFVPLADGEFLALTDEFRQRLNTLSRLSQPHGKELRIHGLAALALDEMIDDIEQLEVDQAWKKHIARIQAAREIEPEVPENLQANLRDYQREGYTWLARLANWGVGACLADDMGLGKTLQGLALILSRCDTGPTLVLAPTSVCMNWASEAERFAPSLQVKDFGGGDRTIRQQLLDSLGPHDLLVCSYGLIQQEDVAAMLAAICWQNIVLDEAQAIKNHATKRSQAVMALQGNFKIIMTGTPIENHLGELWNLFRFINPGLLGSLDSFNLRFATPIERDQDNNASDTLRRLIQPFILRRTKDQVLKELPSRTEITLPIELSTEEIAFYEALRREALEKLNSSDMQAGQKHLQVLAEIMKLRRACCNPSLVKPELAIPSTKLEQFSDLIAELLDNGHKALVFSQFVDHLKILRNHLDQQQIAYQYLDGSTPAKKRKQSVNAFQQGEGDVFLISLKAGGTGLNLTAADYVIHMDPWWNPAVEDQASDRAHRIGQQRPVTIYRLVAKGTIEDKIVALHQVKRDLADSLLTGTDMSSKVSTEQLLSLIQQ